MLLDQSVVNRLQNGSLFQVVPEGKSIYWGTIHHQVTEYKQCRPSSFKHSLPCSDQDSDTDSDLSLDEERSLSIPSSESEENVHLRGRFQRQFKRAAHSERLLTNPSNTTPKGKYMEGLHRLRTLD